MAAYLATLRPRSVPTEPIIVSSRANGSAVIPTRPGTTTNSVLPERDVLTRLERDVADGRTNRLRRHDRPLNHASASPLLRARA
jgi:hypothetical protein